MSPKKTVPKKAASRKSGGKKTAGVKRPPATRRSRRKNLRDAINVCALIEALEQHVLGEKKMTATQVSAALALLKKTLPDIAAAQGKAGTENAATATHEDALRALE